MNSTIEEPSLGVSIIVPCYNEEGTLEEVVSAISRQLESREQDFEILLVNDGSKDNTFSIATSLEATNPAVRLIDHMRNFGQTQAYQSGFDQARGEYVILYSADMETPPEMILEVMEKLDAGYDFVNTMRKNRWSPLHALKSGLANALLNRISRLRIKDRGSGLKGMRWEVAKAFTLYGEWHRFLPDYATLYTDRVVEIEVPFAERKSGVSAYRGRLKTLSVFLDLATVAFIISSHRKPFLMLPGRLFGFTGALLGLVGFVLTAWLSFTKVFFGEPLADRPLFLISILLTVLGITMIMVGVLGELVMMISARYQQRPLIRGRRGPRKGDRPRFKDSLS